jgi:hypothetical protein
MCVVCIRFRYATVNQEARGNAPGAKCSVRIYMRMDHESRRVRRVDTSRYGSTRVVTGRARVVTGRARVVTSHGRVVTGHGRVVARTRRRQGQLGIRRFTMSPDRPRSRGYPERCWAPCRTSSFSVRHRRQTTSGQISVSRIGSEFTSSDRRALDTPVSERAPALAANRRSVSCR